MSELPGRASVDQSSRVARKALVSRSRGMRAVLASGVVCTVCAVALTGCASSGQPQSDMPPAGSSPEVSTTVPPPPLSPAAYQDALSSADSALAPAFGHLMAAGSTEDARAALDEASTATSQAAGQLETLRCDPPVEVPATHRDLITGLRQLAAELSALSSQVASMELCAMPSILPSVSNTTGMNNLRMVRDTLGSGQLGASYQWGQFLPAAIPLPDRQLANGQLLDSQRHNGRGQLKIDNDDEHDAVVKLVQDGRPIMSVYVVHSSSATVGQINDGSYELFYTSGMDWDGQLGTFTRSCLFERFEQTADFTTKTIQGGIEYTVQSIGLKPRIGGNAQTDPVSPQSFPR